MKAYILHHDQCLDRKDIVQDLRQKTGATVLEACWEEDRNHGCSLSHMKAAWQAKEDAPDRHYLVFEDDCDLLEDIDVILNSFQPADVTYLGYNGLSVKDGLVFGTHALLLSPRARDVILHYADWSNEPFDHILSKLCRSFSLTVEKPSFRDKERFACQRKGLVSTITGAPRK
jgi:hypothetical protein